MQPEPGSKPPRLILIGGGVRSGKSAFALAYAARLADPGVFLATAEPLDDDMRTRIGRHRAERGPTWDTREEPVALVEALAEVSRERLVLVDCLTLWLSNLLLREIPDRDILDRIERFAEVARARVAPTLVVTNEVGMGVVPETALGRAFRDLAGMAHQRLACSADEAYAAMLGMVVRLHPGPLQTFRAGEIP